MRRNCSTCSSRGISRRAEYVASDDDDLNWFECANHEFDDNLAQTKRIRREPINAFLSRLGLLESEFFHESDDAVLEPAPSTEREPPRY